MFIAGEKIYFRPLQLSDVDGGYLNWINDREVIRFLDSGHFPITRGQLEKYILGAIESKDIVFFAVIDRESDRHIGNVKLGPIDWVNRCAEFGRLIGPDCSRGVGIGREITNLILEYGFLTLNLNKITAGAVVENTASIQSNKKAGLEVEGVLKEQIFFQGRFTDAVRLGITRTRFLALRKESAQKKI